MSSSSSDSIQDVDRRVQDLLAKMTLAEKIGQMNQQNASEENAAGYLGDDLRAGRIGSVLNVSDLATVNELQRIATKESRLGIPLLVGRDVIHGFRTIAPIPLGQAATWNPELVQRGARLAAKEAATRGINWTFAPMVDISRDARWGRIAESFGEDVFLSNRFAEAMVKGFQGDDLRAPDSIAACVKHFAGYGASESGRDYATTNIPENELRNVYLPPFKAGIDAGALTLMTSFSDVNGVPATANRFLLQQVLRDEWDFGGVVVSDWDSVRQLEIHGLTPNATESGFEALTAGVDMEMAGGAFITHLQELIAAGRVSESAIDAAVCRILRAKFLLGLFEPGAVCVEPDNGAGLVTDEALAVSKALATQSLVLLKNDNGALPLDERTLSSVAVIGPLAEAPYEQLGTWIFDGNANDSVTPLAAIRRHLGDAVTLTHVPAMEHSRSRYSERFAQAAQAARESDIALLFLGEESILSGEAHCRADISLPGDQARLVEEVRAQGVPVIAVVMAGRPLTLGNVLNQVDALLYAWHPGTMGGEAICDVLFGLTCPSGKLPATFPNAVGQIPIYYNQKHTGKPPTPDTVVHIDDIDAQAPQTSLGMTAFHLDAGYLPQFPFGFGLSYTEFEYADLNLNTEQLEFTQILEIAVRLTNRGERAGTEVVQLYVRDLVGQVTRPVKELKGFKRVHLQAGESATVRFELRAADLSFYGRHMQPVTEAGDFQVWVGGDSSTTLSRSFTLTAERSH